MLFHNKPSPAQFEQFVATLQSEIAAAHNAPPRFTGTIASELRELMRLKDEGVISEEEFQTAKAKAISSEANQGRWTTIGFGQTGDG